MITPKNKLVLVASCLLVFACNSENSRYRDTSVLERPPTLALQQNTQNTPVVIDDSVEPKKKMPGLRSLVTLREEPSKGVLIEQPITQAWRTLGVALRQSEIKITDYEKGKYNYYVNYRSQSVFTNVLHYLNEEEVKTIYLLTLKSQGDNTFIQAELASNNEQNSQNADGVVTKTGDDSEGLIDAIYHLLHDDMKTE
ncbi:MAG TPA: hypothetical protein DF614_07190 [Methylococcaceae bacterium]|nr:hypothetical protein [Methylococcaceae bacterium]